MSSPTVTSRQVELVDLAGDRAQGVATDYDMTGGAHAKVKLHYAGRYARPYASLVIECEVYKAPDGMLSVHSICPKCNKAIMIRGDQKRIDLDGDDKLYVEPFSCTWELEGDRAIQYGIGLCRFRSAYDGKVVKEA